MEVECIFGEENESIKNGGLKNAYIVIGNLKKLFLVKTIQIAHTSTLKLTLKRCLNF